eukprot:779128-Pelagomonas_calceolata.AAC.1
MGLDIFYPRSLEHWKAVRRFVERVLLGKADDYVKTAGAVHSELAGSDFLMPYVMRNATTFCSGTDDWK